MPLGTTTVGFTITNPAGRPRHVLGASGGCKVNCLQPGEDRRFVIPAGGTLEYPCELTVRRPGPFQVEMTVLLEDNGIRPVVLTARGQGISTDTPHDPPPGP
ncbi:MAG: hypothetical protein K2X87_09135 [Gemmataceae bacterium]|nr:hypothetical protein [Gemmataceae bacterium]